MEERFARLEEVNKGYLQRVMVLKLWEILGEEVGDVIGWAAVGGVGAHTNSLSHTRGALDLCDLLGGGPVGILLLEAEEEGLMVEDEEGLGCIEFE